MSMISELVDRLRTESKSMGKYGTDYMATLLMQASATIITLSEKARADRPQGEWIVTDEDGWANGTHALICSECGEGYHLNIERVIGDWNFCPNCGAKMKGADDE